MRWFQHQARSRRSSRGRWEFAVSSAFALLALIWSLGSWGSGSPARAFGGGPGGGPDDEVGGIPTSDPAPPVEALSLARELAPRVRALGRDVYTYHYMVRSRAGLPEEGYVRPDHALVEPYLRHKVGRFWDQDFYRPSPGNPISALYVATDPVASRIFGGRGEDWALLEIVLGRGFRYLDLRTEDGERRATDLLPEPWQEQLAAAGCPVRYAVDLFVDRGPRPCRTIVEGTLSELDVDGLLYDFRAVPLEECSEGRHQGAFVLLRLEALDLPRVRLFVHERREDGASDRRRRIRGLFARARAAGSRQASLWPDLEVSDPPEEPSPAWLRQHLFGCGAHPEDRFAGHAPDDPVAAWRNAELSLVWEGAPPEETALAARHLAAAQAAAGDWAGARAGYRRALDRDPDHVEALHDLVWLSLEPGEGRDPERTVELAERLVQVTHYRDRRSTVGWNWSKAIKGRASLTVAAAYAAAGKWDLARGYAYQHYETAAKQHRDSGTPLTARRVERAERCRRAYARRQRCEPPPFRRWSESGVPPIPGINGMPGAGGRSRPAGGTSLKRHLPEVASP